jgi:hypothetical protein
VCLAAQCGLHQKNKAGTANYPISHAAARFSSGALDHIAQQQACKAKKFIKNREIVSNDLIDQHFNLKDTLSPIKESPDEDEHETPDDEDDSMEEDSNSEQSDDSTKENKDSDKQVLERVESGLRSALSDSLCTGGNPEVCDRLATLADYIRVHLG